MRGLNRTDIAKALLKKPGMTIVFPAIIPLYAARATSFEFIVPNLNKRDFSISARLANFVAVAPGQKHVTVDINCARSRPIPLDAPVISAICRGGARC